jgi:acyl dehydratase
MAEVGTELPEQTFPVTRADLVRYAGASGDFNPIHWNQRVATAVGLPDVIAHGMLTMARSRSTTSGSAARSSSRTTRPARRSPFVPRSPPCSTTDGCAWT